MAKRVEKIDLETQTASFDLVIKELKTGKVRPWYCFTGPEVFFLDRLQDAFDKLVPDDLKDFNYNLFYGRESRPDRVVETARSYPMMADRRLVVVRDFLQLGQKPSGDEEEEEGGSGDGTINDLIPYLQKPNPTCVLLLIDANSNVPGNKKIGKAIKDSSIGYHQHFETQLIDGLAEWVQVWAKTQRHRLIETNAASLLVQMVGDSLSALSTELDKLFTFKDSGESVTIDDVKKVVGETRHFNAEELKSAIIQRDQTKALHIAEQLLQQSDNITGTVIRTVAFLNFVFISLWQMRLQIDRNLSEAQIAENLKMPPFGAFKYQLAEARRFRNAGQVQLMLEYLLDAEASVKGFTRIDVRSTFLMLVTKLTTA